jgi:hypothetical protein
MDRPDIRCVLVSNGSRRSFAVECLNDNSAVVVGQEEPPPESDDRSDAPFANTRRNRMESHDRLKVTTVRPLSASNRVCGCQNEREQYSFGPRKTRILCLVRATRSVVATTVPVPEMI